MADWHHQRQRQRRRRFLAAVLLLVAFTASVCYDVLLNIAVPDTKNIIDDDASHHSHSNNRHLLSTLDESNLMAKYDSDLVREAALKSGADTKNANIAGENLPHRRAAERKPHPNISSSYTLIDAISESNVWEHTFALIIYDPASDTFIGHYNSHHNWRASSKKLWSSMTFFCSMLRRVFPERFTKNNNDNDGVMDEMVFAIGSGDYPHLKLAQLPWQSGVTPVLFFGSVFQDTELYPNMIPMPMPGLHLGCFEEWARFNRVCGGFRSLVDKSNPHGLLLFGDEMGLEWDDLIPQVIWRGTDFGYLPTLRRPKHTQPINNNIEKAVIKRKAGRRNPKVAATNVLRENYDQLLPRWKGAVLTAEAEIKMDSNVKRGTGGLPWANMKFSRHMNMGMLPPVIGSTKYKEYDEVGIATGNFMSRMELVKYMYHIDLAGGGGTTWTGTTEKLAMPGLLFHHITPTKDYIHDRIQPWKHYIPVATDLSDLKSKFDWAEANPLEAKKIADQGTEFVKHLGTPDGFRQMFEEDFVDPVRQIIDAYQPVSRTHPGKTWKEVLEEEEAVKVKEKRCCGKMEPVIRCSGLSNNPSSCHSIREGGHTWDEW